MAGDTSSGSVILSSTLSPTKGFHTTSTTRFALRGSHAHTCTLHLYFTLPAQLFVDPYELANRRASYSFERFGGGNLEAPASAPGASGPSALLLDVNIPERVDNKVQDQGDGDGNVFSIEVPLHARYGTPKRGDGLIDEIMFPPPVAFWACPQEGASGSGGTTLAFHYPLIVKLFITSWVSLFTAKRTQAPDVLHFALKDDSSTLALIPHVGSVRSQTLRVPVGDAGDVGIVGTGTVVVILFAFVYLLRTIVRASRTRRVAEVTATKKDS